MVKHSISNTGYKQQQLDAGSNIAKAQLNLQFKPWFKPIVISSDEEDATITFHGMKINENSMVKILFRANPKPSEGQWIIRNTIVPIGKAQKTLPLNSTTQSFYVIIVLSTEVYFFLYKF